MGDFEFFAGSEAAEGMDPAAFERFKAKMKRNAAFVAALRKGEQKAREDESRLIKLLMRYLKEHANTIILVLASALIEKNIPALFILKLLSLGNEEIKDELKKVRLELQSGAPQIGTGEGPSRSLTLFGENSALPLKVKADLNEWGEELWEAASRQPLRLLETALDEEGNTKVVILDCGTRILEEYLAANNTPEEMRGQERDFVHLLLGAIFKRAKEQIESQAKLETTQKAEWDE